MTKNAFNAAILAVLIIAPIVISDDKTPIPSQQSQVSSWLKTNIKPANERKGTLDTNLATAEAKPKVIKVSKNGKGSDFSTINDAIKSIPSGNKKRVIVSIGEGEYNEKITIDKTKPFVTLYGESKAMTNLTYSGTAAKYGTVDSATLIVESDYFMAVNLFVVNSSPKPDGKRKGAQAVAMRISGDKAAFYHCKFIGFQDTLCDDKGNHFFHNCYVEGTVDFIFGSGKSLYLNSELHAIPDEGFRAITAQARKSSSEDNGYSFVHCNVTGQGKSGIYLGRAWMNAPMVVYAYTVMGNIVNPAGWSTNFHPDRAKTVFYGEYKCWGPRSSETSRVKYTKQLSDKEAERFLVLGYIQGSKWLLPPPKL